MHAILVTAGTDGDVHPFVGLGACLRTKGHQVTLLANENFRSVATEQSLAFRPLLTDQETNDLLDNPNVWRPIKSGLIAAQWGVRSIEKQYELLKEIGTGKDEIVVAYPPIFAARLLHEALSRPLVSLVVMPWMAPSVFRPAIAGVIPCPKWMPEWGTLFYWRLLHAVGDLLVGRHVNTIRKSLGLQPIRRVFEWWFSPQRIIAMFPDWYAPPQTAAAPEIRFAGFPMFDRSLGPLPSDLLEFCKAGDPPVAFTFGTGNKHAARSFRAAIEACGILGTRGILLTKFGHQLPPELPASIRYCPYAPFSQLFPHCAAIVHHGGFGTTSQALAAGKPQLILPMAFDQPDNAARAKQLGVAESIKPSSSGAQIAARLAKLMRPQSQAACQALATRLTGQDPFAIAAEWIEEVADRS